MTSKIVNSTFQPDRWDTHDDFGAHGAFYDDKMCDDVKAVVVGFDKYFNYVKLCKATVYLNNPDCTLIATNTDEQFPQHSGIRIPGKLCDYVGPRLSALFWC